LYIRENVFSVIAIVVVFYVVIRYMRVRYAGHVV